MNERINEITAKYPIFSYFEDEVIADHKHLFDIGGFGRIVIRGQTPSFNDGDVCRHSEYAEDDTNDPNYVESADAAESLQALADLEHVRTALYETNYEIIMERDADGIISWSNEYYNSDY